MVNGHTDLETQAMGLFERALGQKAEARTQWILAQEDIELAVRERAIELLTFDEGSAHVIQTGQALRDSEVDTPVPEHIGAYKIVELIGQGGMGAVYRGLRDVGDFEHDVAIKVIRPSALSDTLVERFQHERQTLAKLSHPNIARLYDGGTTIDGAPFIIMEFIDGSPITDWAQRKGLGETERIELFTTVCHAVQYAHQNLVIHRDITPNNVLVTKQGIIKLIDFGIAKALDENAPVDISENSLASLSFTPGFAAPERSKGAAANTLSDIYSLGKLLEALLEKQEVSGELQSIIDKATAKNPANRYATIYALIVDIERLRAGFSVHAYPGSKIYKLKKFIRRNALMVSASTLAFLGLVSALGVTTYLYQQAEIARQAANQRFEETQELAEFQMFELYDELEKVNGNMKSLEKISEKAYQYLEALSKDERASLDLKIDMARGYKRLADILGNPKNANLGKREQTGPMLVKSMAILEDIIKKAPDNQKALTALGEVAFSMSTYQYISESNNLAAYEYALRAVDAFKQSNALDPQLETQTQLVRATMMSGVPLFWIERADEGLILLKNALRQAEDLLERHPNNTVLLRISGSINVEIARGLTRMTGTQADTQEAVLPYWDKAVASRNKQLEIAPDDDRPQRSLIILLYERGARKRWLGNVDGALNDMDMAYDIGEKVIAIEPDNARINRIMNGILFQKALVLETANRLDEATRLLDTALLEIQSSLEGMESNKGLVREAAYNKGLSARIYFNANNFAKGCETMKAAKLDWGSVETLGGIDPLDHDDAYASLLQLLETYTDQCKAE